jgi:hypothetical protein
MKVATPGDTLIFDRGYFSKKLFREGVDRHLNVIFRLKRDAFKECSKFYYSLKNTQYVSFVYDGKITKGFLYKYFIEGKKYICLSNFYTSPNHIKEMYAKRWTVETNFRRLKTDLNLEVSHSMSFELFVQEIEIRILTDTISVLIRPTSSDTSIGKSYFKRLDNFIRITNTITKVINDEYSPIKKNILEYLNLENFFEFKNRKFLNVPSEAFS